MNNPPKEIDGAIVIEWAWSGQSPFGILHYSDGKVAAEIFGLAICQYEDSTQFYRFSCSADWESQQDDVYESVEDAKANLPEQYKNVEATWCRI